MAAFTFPVLEPSLRVSFHYRLQAIRDLYRKDALARTIGTLEIRALDQELSRYVHAEALGRAASFGLRAAVRRRMR